MDLKTFLSCQDWLTDIPVAEDSAEDGHDPSISSPPRKRRRRSSQARETRTPHAKCVLRGHLRFAAAWEQFGASPGVPGAPATAVPDSQASAQTSQASAVSAKAKTPKKKVEPPMILYFSPPGRADADEELVDSLAQSLPPRPPRFADTRRNGRIVIPLEASSKKDLRADRDLSRFTYSLYQHPTHPLLFLSLDFPEPVIYAVDPKRIRLLSLPPADPNPGPIPPHATFVFDTGCTLLFEAEVKEDGKGREARGQRAKLAATLRKSFTSLMKHVVSRHPSTAIPNVVTIAGLQYQLAPPPLPPLPTEATVLAALELAKKAQRRAMDALGAGQQGENEELKGSVSSFAQIHLARSPRAR